MNYVEHVFQFPCTDGSVVERVGMMAEGTGLGYYTQLSGGLYLWPTGSGKVSCEPEGWMRYVLTHIESGCTFGCFVYTEQHVRNLLLRVAPLCDWRLPVAALVRQPGYPTAETMCELLLAAGKDCGL